MKSQIHLGSIFGIRIGLHLSWFLIALLIVLSLYGDLRGAHPGWAPVLILALALATALLFFVSLLAHELSHSLVARAHGLPVSEITLFALGGVSQIEKEAVTARTEFRVAVVGPLTSALIGLTCLGAFHLAGAPPQSAIWAMVSWLGYINLMLAGFNLIPGYPLDGGRILRALIWWKTGDLNRATRLSARTGQAVGSAFIALGVIEYFSGASIGALWIAFIGWFLFHAAGQSYVQAGLRQSLQGVRVSDLMLRDCPTVDGGDSISDFVDHQLLRTGRRCFIVLHGGAVAGILTPGEIKHTSRDRWSTTPVDKVMRPLDVIQSVGPQDSLASALEIMARNDLNQLPVISDGHLAGLMTRAELLSYLQNQADLQAK